MCFVTRFIPSTKLKWLNPNKYNKEISEAYTSQYSEGLSHHNMASPQVTDRENCLQLWQVAVDTMNKQPGTADKG
jgi:hypothetical protein